MTTPAQRAGIVAGKHYKVSSDQKHVDGGVYELDRDDGTELPYFRLVPGFKGKQDERACVWVNGESNTVLTDVTNAEAAAVHVSLNGNSTTIVVQRNLTSDEVAAVLKAIGN